MTPADIAALRAGHCLAVIPETFIACGEGGSYCSETCRLRTLLREAVEIGMAWAARLRDQHNDPMDRTRLAAIASEGGGEVSDEKTLDNKQLDMLRMIADTHHRTECASWKLLWLIDQHRALSTALATAIAERDAARAEVERACCRGEPHTCDQERVAAAEGRTDRLIIELAEVRARLAEREAQIDATRKPLDIDCTEHAELNGHLDITEQCHDWLSAEADIGDDPSGKMRDFAAALRIVIDQCKKQRRRANWYICAYDAGRAKLVEHWQAKTADAIAAFVETSPQTGDYDFERLASDIRTGGWRKEPK